MSDPANVSDPQAARWLPYAAPLRRSAAPRWLAALTLLLAAAVLAVAGWLKPDARGFGTHEQLGTAACGMLLVTGYPCPTCGMTTSFAHTVRLQWLRAFHVQPGGFVLCLVTAAAAGISLWVLACGRWPGWLVRAMRSYWLFVGLLAVLLGGWAYKLAVGLATQTLPLR